MAAPFSLTSIVKPKTPITVVDVGAMYIEAPSYNSLIKNGVARLIGFEPNESECRKLESIYGPPHQFFPCFISDGAAATFYETNWTPTGSLFKPNRKLLEKFQALGEVVTLVKEHPVQTTALDNIPQISDIDFLKLDIQGAELNALQGARRLLQGVGLIQLEVEFLELYEGQPLYGDVDRFLRGAGFSFHTFDYLQGRCVKPLIVNNDINAPMRQQLWADAIYIRNWIEPGQIPVEKLIKLAILLHDVIGSSDICHYLLTQIDAVSGSDFARTYLVKLTTP